MSRCPLALKLWQARQPGRGLLFVGLLMFLPATSAGAVCPGSMASVAAPNAGLVWDDIVQLELGQ